MKYFLVMDIGGTKTSAALFTRDGDLYQNFIYVKQSMTFCGEDAVYQNSKDALNFILQKFQIELSDVLGIGVGAPGPLDSRNGVIIKAPLMGWKNFPLVQRLKGDFGIPVALDKDCNLGALAEQRAGMAKGLLNVIYITVSTGVGAGIMLNGNIYHGRTCSAAEFGHISIEENGKPCPCGNLGCLEMYCSGTAVKQKLREDYGRGIKSLVFDMADGDVQKLDAGLLSEAAAKKDQYALDIFGYVGRTLGAGIAIVFNLLDPDIVVIGGGVSKSREYFAGPLFETAKRRSIVQIEDRHIVYSSMCDTVVLHGAYYLIKDFLERGM